jgi:hypothetical protein
MKLILRSGCEDGNCPKISDVVGDGLDDMVAIQGANAPGMQDIPDRESVVLVPRRIVLEYADSLRKEGRG